MTTYDRDYVLLTSGISKVLGVRRQFLVMNVDGGFAVMLYRDMSRVWTREAKYQGFDDAIRFAQEMDESLRKLEAANNEWLRQSIHKRFGEVSE